MGVAAGGELGIDARATGLGVAVVLLVLRAPFLDVVGGVALTAALLRLLVAPSSRRQNRPVPAAPLGDATGTGAFDQAGLRP